MKKMFIFFIPICLATSHSGWRRCFDWSEQRYTNAPAFIQVTHPLVKDADKKRDRRSALMRTAERKYKICICKIKEAADSYTIKVIMAQVLRPNNAEAPRGSNQKFILIIMWILH